MMVGGRRKGIERTRKDTLFREAESGTSRRHG